MIQVLQVTIELVILGGLIEWAKDKTFTEYLVKVDRNSYITSEDETESLFSFGEIMQTIKREIIYVET